MVASVLLVKFVQKRTVNDMRLIDANNFHVPKGFFNDGINVPKLFALLGMQPTIDATPVRHGKWEKAKYIEAPVYICSECGNREPLRRNYCPECGCKMEG